MQLGEPDESGRKRPIPIENSEFLIDTDTTIIAIGTRANPILTKSIPELRLNKLLEVLLSYLLWVQEKERLRQ